MEVSGKDFHAEYELLGEIGRGGMGVIYKAHHPRLNRVVAIKVILAAHSAGEPARRRFEAEMQMAARLSHPNIVPVFDTGVMDDCPCFCMEYFAGGPLSEQMMEFTGRPEASARLVTKVARAISFAHQRGVLHRDLKPANILLDSESEPHVADFGLAKELHSDSNLTHNGAILGSPNYMSPEQAAGKVDALTVSTDIYSLGAILYELLTGRPPFLASTALETLRLVEEKDPVRPSTVSHGIDRDLEIICLKCLEKDPAQRYATAGDLADDLERWRRHEPIYARPGSKVERLSKWARRHPALATLTVALLLVFVAGITGVLWQWQRAEEARRNEAQQLRRAEAALARSAMALADAALREGNGPAVRAALDNVPDERRDATWHYLLRESDTSRLLPEIGVTNVNDLAANPNRPSVFAAADRDGRVVVFDVRAGKRLLDFTPTFATAASNTLLRLAFSRGGDRIVIGRDGPGGLVIYETRAGRKIAEWPAPPSGQWGLEFEEEGILQTSADRHTTQLWKADDGTLRWTLKEGYQSSSFAADTHALLSYSWNSQLCLVNTDNAAILLRLTDNYFERFAAQPGGNKIVAANPLGFVRGIDLSDGHQRFEFQPHESPIQRVVFLPGGERFLTAATLPDGRQALQCWESGNGRACQILTGGVGDIRALALHPLSGELIVSGRETRVWEATGLPAVRVIRTQNVHPSAMFWGSEDQIFAPSPNGSLGAELQSFSGVPPTIVWQPPDNGYGQPSVSADGRRVAMGRYNSGARILVLEREGTEIKQVASLKPKRMISHIRLSPSGDRVAVMQQDFAAIGILDVATDQPAVMLDAPKMQRFSDVAWLENGKRLAGLVTTHAPRNAAGSAEEIVLWDTLTGQILRSVTNASVASLACAAPDGHRFAEAGADRKVRIRDGATLEVQQEFRVHNAPITALAWHPTKAVLATASEDLVIRLWNLADGTRLEEIRGPLSPPSVLSFNSSGTRLATAARDRAVRIWEPRSLAP